ncbi:MAG TPA: hypothetical protein VJ810_01400 [Blastocatellia bacterium]|nr:hypothetical protein [Blastocatellia bacterium]
MLNKIYLTLGFGIVLFYAVTAFFGHEYGSSQRRNLPNELRSSSGIRSFSYWHDGYHGGK